MRPIFQTACLCLKCVGLYHASLHACTAFPRVGLQVHKHQLAPGTVQNRMDVTTPILSRAAEEDPCQRAHVGRAGAVLADVPGSPASLRAPAASRRAGARGGAGPVAQSELPRPRGPGGAGGDALVYFYPGGSSSSAAPARPPLLLPAPAPTAAPPIKRRPRGAEDAALQLRDHPLPGGRHRSSRRGLAELRRGLQGLLVAGTLPRGGTERR